MPHRRRKKYTPEHPFFSFHRANSHNHDSNQNPRQLCKQRTSPIRMREIYKRTKPFAEIFLNTEKILRSINCRATWRKELRDFNRVGPCQCIHVRNFLQFPVPMQEAITSDYTHARGVEVKMNAYAPLARHLIS